MMNPIPKSGMFATPEDFGALQAYVSQFSGSERQVAMVIMMMTMNLCNDLVEQAHTEGAFAC